MQRFDSSPHFSLRDGRIRIHALLALVVLLGGTLLWARIRYPNLTAGTFYMLQDSGFRETAHLVSFMLYWIPQMDSLEVQPETGYFTLPSNRAEDDFEEAKRLFHLGDFPAAAALLSQLIGQQGENEDRLFWLAITQMRLAEANNCLAALRNPENRLHTVHASHQSNQAWCTLPLTKHHARKESATAAIQTLRKLLERYDSESSLYRWLLNFCYMTIDGYPDQVPAQYRLKTRFTDFFYGKPAEGQGAAAADLSFSDRAAEFGIDTFDSGRGVAVEDFDGDGRLDIITGGSFDPLRYYRNRGEGFEDVTAGSGLEDAIQAHLVSAADFNNDGRMDVFVASFFQPFRLFQNVDGRSFEDVTEAVGLRDGADGKRTFGWTSAWGDVDNDGDLDLFHASWGTRIPLVWDFMAEGRADSRLFLQENGRFVDRTDVFGLGPYVSDQPMIGAAFGDFDNDGFADLFLSSATKRQSVLLHNEGGQRFTPHSRFGSSFVGSFVDVDHDGNLEIFLNSGGEARTSTEKAVFGMDYGDPDTGRALVLKRDDTGRFEPLHGFFDDMTIGSMGASYGDLNNDGCLDFYLGTGGPEPWFVLPNLMYLGRTDGTGCALATENISRLHGFGTIQKGHGIVFFDWDEDGDQDVYSSLGGMWPADRWPNQFFVNESELDQSWIKIRLHGRRTNRFGVGCRIRVDALTADGKPVVRTYHMDQKTTFGSAPFLAHIGLGESTSVESVRVYWPGSGAWQSYEADLNNLNHFTEPD